EAAFSIRDQQLDRDLITYAFAGLRVLPGGPGDTAKAKRETVVTEGRAGMLSVAGGKWTTFRHIGRTVMQKLQSLPGHPLGEDFEPVSALPKKLPLPGVANPRAVAHRLLVDGPAPGPRMAADTARHLATHYGSLAFDIARLANDDPALAQRVHPDAPEIWAQVVRARDHEWAETADDVLRRRTTLTIRGLATDQVRGRVRGLLDRKQAAQRGRGSVPPTPRGGRGTGRGGSTPTEPPLPRVRPRACPSPSRAGGGRVAGRRTPRVPVLRRRPHHGVLARE